jgi:non-homologous end joining protein Ku
MLEEKQKGQEITAAPPRPAAGPVIDLMEAPKRSMRRRGREEVNRECEKPEEGLNHRVMVPTVNVLLDQHPLIRRAALL